jgi:hypothetical protein
MITVQFLVLCSVWCVCAGANGSNEAVLDESTYDLAGYAYEADVSAAESNYTVVDDMESYNESNNLIWDTWLDDCAHSMPDPDWCTGSCIWLVVDPFGPVHSGTQSMEYSYNNVLSPERCGNFSEVRRYYDPPVDWASHGEKALVLWFHGTVGNESTPMWVVVSSYSGYSETATYGDNGEDPEDIKVAEWTEWNIKLSYFADGGVDLANVSSISIGFGDWIGGVPDNATGIVYFDDIRLYPARCVAMYAPAADLSGDCVVDWRDLRLMAEQWLYAGIESPQGITSDQAVSDTAKTNLWAEETLPCQASSPCPNDGSEQVSAHGPVVLSWTAGEDLGLGRHFVYFSDNEDCVANTVCGDNSADCFRVMLRSSYAFWSAGMLELWKTYYWRVDEFGIQCCEGNVWSFTTGCALVGGDLNADCLVNFTDYAELMGGWLDDAPLWPTE